jgi:hypothetical protein
VVGTARQLAEQNKNRFAIEAQENLGTLTVDPMRLRQIVLNLLSMPASSPNRRGQAAGTQGRQRSRLGRARGR